jgi:hypothetical protein
LPSFDGEKVNSLLKTGEEPLMLLEKARAVMFLLFYQHSIAITKFRSDIQEK